MNGAHKVVNTIHDPFRWESYAETFHFHQEADDEGEGLPAIVALAAVANFAADDWYRAYRPDLTRAVGPMGCYDHIARAVVMALASEPGMLGPKAAAMIADLPAALGTDQDMAISDDVAPGRVLVSESAL